MKDKLQSYSDRLLTLEEAALLLKVKRNTVRNWQNVGTLKRVKLGRTAYCDRQDVEKMLSRIFK